MTQNKNKSLIYEDDILGKTFQNERNKLRHVFCIL